MRVGDIKYHDIANGPGIRVSIFVTGCTHKCVNCFNAELQERDAGRPFTSEDERNILNALGKDYISGFTLLGGEPMQNTRGLTPLVRNIREEYGNTITIWCYSGYTFEQIQHIKSMRELCNMCDVLVDGQFVQRLFRPGLAYRGSTNQRIINIHDTLATNTVCLWNNGIYASGDIQQ